MYVRYARPNQWPDLDQTWHEGSLPPGAQLRGVKVGGGPQGAEPPGENPIFQPGAKRRHGNSAARCRAERRLGINNLRT